MTADAAAQIQQLLTDLLQQRVDWKALCQPVPGLQQADILRTDLLHPVLSGNKALKLAGWWQRYRCGQYKKIITFGGTHSNHLHATAAFAHALEIPLLCLVRGYAEAQLTKTLHDCMSWGAQLEFLDRRAYAARYDEAYLQQLAEQHQALVIPEGGAGAEGMLGCVSLAQFAQHYDQFWLAAGSATTARAVEQGLQQLQANTELVIVNVVADQGALAHGWPVCEGRAGRVRVVDGSLGGFAKQTPELAALMQRYDQLDLPLEPIYTAKLMHALEQYRAGQAVKQQCKTLILHSGGLQGRADRGKYH